MSNLTLGKFRELTASLPDDVQMSYHGYYKGCCLSAYRTEYLWLYPKTESSKRAVVLNPASDYDHRHSRDAERKPEGFEPDSIQAILWKNLEEDLKAEFPGPEEAAFLARLEEVFKKEQLCPTQNQQETSTVS